MRDLALARDPLRARGRRDRDHLEARVQRVGRRVNGAAEARPDDTDSQCAHLDSFAVDVRSDRAARRSVARTKPYPPERAPRSRVKNGRRGRGASLAARCCFLIGVALVSHNRRSYRYALACLGLLFTLAGCGGGGGGGSSTLPPGAAPTPSPAPTATPLPGSSTASIAVSAGSPASATFGPVTGGFSGTVTLPAASASSTLTATFLPGTSAPPGSPAIQNLRRRPANIGAQNIQAIAFITVTPSVTVSFPKTPDFTFTAPFAVAQLGAFAYVAEFDPTQSAKGWTTIEGPAAASGNTLTFTGTLPARTLQAGNTYEFLLFSVASALPTPSPSATPTATATATPSPAPTATPPVSQGTSCAATAAIARRPAARARSGDVVPNRLFVTYRSSAGSRGVHLGRGDRHGRRRDQRRHGLRRQGARHQGRQDDRQRHRSGHERPRYEHRRARDRADEQRLRVRRRRVFDAPAGVRHLPRCHRVERRAERRHRRRGDGDPRRGGIGEDV